MSGVASDCFHDGRACALLDGWLLLPECGGEQIFVEGRVASGDLRPGVATAVCLRVSATRAALLLGGSGGEEGIDECVLVVGRYRQPVLPSATIAAGPCVRQAITGRPQAIASTSTSPNASATEGRTSVSAAFSACGSCS
jgi:hypothetical protein